MDLDDAAEAERSIRAVLAEMDLLRRYLASAERAIEGWRETWKREATALADAQAEIARLRAYLDKAQAHTCPAPEWYPKVRDLLGDVVLAAAFARTDLAELPGHVAELREQALAAAPAPAEDECTCSPCTDPAYGAPGLSHCAACCYGTGIAEYDHDCPNADHRDLARRQFPAPALAREQADPADEEANRG